MKHEYIVDKESHKVCIVIEAYSNFNSPMIYRVCDIGIKEKGKRKFNFIARQITDRWEYRHRDRIGRDEYVREKYLEYVTIEDIQNAVEHAYSKMKPNIDHVEFSAI